MLRSPPIVSLDVDDILAASTGGTNGNITRWISPSELDDAIYITRDVVERWPRATGSWAVTDCN
jgi:hypothetical protein